MKRVNYDAVSSSYNRRFAGETRSATGDSLQALASRWPQGRFLEVGCGTGHWLAELALPGRQVFGLDYSAGMLAQAQRLQLPGGLVRGTAPALPFPAGSFDLVYCVNAIHHFERPEEFVQQAARLLRPGGALAVIGMTPRRTDWYVYEYFEQTYENDLRRFPSWGTVLDWATAAGFERAEWHLVEKIVDPKRGRAVLADPFLEKNSTSQLILLDDETYAAGIGRLKEAIAAGEAAGEECLFRSVIEMRMLVAWR